MVGRQAWLGWIVAAGLAIALALPAGGATAADLVDTIKRVKPGVVGIGTYQVTRRPPHNLHGTGFVVGDGLFVVTNAHVVPKEIDTKHQEALVVFVPRDNGFQVRPVGRAALDREHDMAVLRVAGKPLPALQLGDDSAVAEGQAVAFTGFPIGAVLGLYPVTHRGIVSSITPYAIPQRHQQTLDAKTIKRLRDPFHVFQLDATAYPGNSGSPLYDQATGAVVGVVGSTIVKQSREKMLQDPSGITYAIPIRFAKALIAQFPREAGK